jgi:hypothetical protein
MRLMLTVGATMIALVALTISSAAQEAGRRAELEAGQVAPFAGVLLDDAALALVAEELAAVRAEAEDLRLALAAQRQATAAADLRAELWKAESQGSGFRRFASGAAKYTAIGCITFGLGAWAAGRAPD